MVAHAMPYPRRTPSVQAMFQPHTATCNNSRYLVNALWVCARVGAWGDGSFAAAMVDRLRQNNYALVNSAVGQAHGNLWWSLSQWAQHQQAQGQAGAQGPPDVAQACWDVLEASAGAIKRAPYLDQSSFKPQVGLWPMPLVAVVAVSPSGGTRVASGRRYW